MTYRRSKHVGYVHRGFTLIELMMVMTIMAIVYAIAAPRFSNSIQRARLDAAAQRVAADLNMAKSRANLTSTSLTVTFTLATSQYQIPAIKDLDRPLNPYTAKLTDEPYRASIKSTNIGGVLQTSGVSQISYNGFGLPSTGGSIVVGVGNATKTISIDSLTGRAQIR